MGRAVIKAAVRSFLVELLAPCGNLSPRVPKVPKPLRVQAFVSEPTVKTLDMGVLNGFAWLDMSQFDALIDAPGQEVSRGQFGAIVHPNPFRFAAFGDHTIQRSGDTSAGQAGIDF